MSPNPNWFLDQTCTSVRGYLKLIIKVKRRDQAKGRNVRIITGN